MFVRNFRVRVEVRKIRLAWAAMVLLISNSILLAQGLFQYDQQTANQDLLNENSGGIDLSRQPLGQSFTPSLNAIGFIRLYLSSGGTAGSGTFNINLRSDSVTGALLGTSDSVTLPAQTVGFVDFLFHTPVSVTPGNTYFFQPQQTSGTGWATDGSSLYNYSGGNGFVDGATLPQFDLWFREGVVVPEPSSIMVLLTGVLAIGIARPALRRR